MRVLITGGGGFLGSHLVESQLAQGHEVRAIDLHTEQLAHLASQDRLHVVTGSIEDADTLTNLLDGVNVVYHLASAHLDVSLSDAHYRRINVDATLQLVKLAQAAGVDRFVHCSSVGVIGNVTDPPANEDTPCAPTNIYEQTKLEGERAALAFAEAQDFPLVAVRPAWIYGPRCPRTRKLMRNIAKGRFPVFGDGQNLRHPVYVSDAVMGLEACAADRSAQGKLYIIAGQEAVSVETLLITIANVMNVRPPSIYLPVALGLAGGIGLELAAGLLGKGAPFSRRSMDFFLKNNAYDISRARQELGFEPQVDLERGMTMTLDSQDNAYG